METLKNVNEICQKDPRNDSFTVLDPSHPCLIRRPTMEAFQHGAESIRLQDGMLERVRSHFETAYNLIIYSKFYYPFNVAAQLYAHTSVEFALRTKTRDHKPPFNFLLKSAVDQGWIGDQCFSITGTTL